MIGPFLKPEFEDLYVVQEFTNGDSSGLQARWHKNAMGRREPLETIWEFHHEVPWWVKDALLDAYARGLKHGLEINY